MSKANVEVANIPVHDLKVRLDKARAHLAAIQELLPGLVSLDHDARVHSGGRLRGGEVEALSAVLDAVKSDPAPYAFLADRDDGNDPKALETDLLRDRLAHVEALRSFAADVQRLADDVGDTALDLGARVRPVLLAAYKVARVAAEGSAKTRTQLAKAVDFYGAIRRAGDAARAKNAKKGAPVSAA